MPVITRAEGYELARGKEDPALDVVRDCIKAVMGLEAALIPAGERNRLEGDLELVGTAECKGQPIDPERYDFNFVEVFEDVSAVANDQNRDGLARTAEILGIRGLSTLYYKDYRDPARPSRPIGDISHVSASLESINGSDLTIFANADPKRTFVYFYTRTYLLTAIRKAVSCGGLRRGMGRSNDDTFGVLVPVSRARWRRVADNWTYVGEGKPPVDKIRAAFTTEKTT